MFEIIERKSIVPNLHLLTARAPEVAATIQPGQFVIVRSHDDAERIPLSVADWDRELGTVTFIFMEVGASTGRLATLKPGDALPTLVGPLGKPSEIANFGTVACVAGCYGIGSIYPVIRALRAAGNEVVAAVEARSSYLLYWEDRIKPLCRRLFVVTRDGSAGAKGHIRRIRELFQENGIVPNRIIVNGCTFLMARSARELAVLDAPIMVNLNPIMIDGTGMCGVCRVTVGKNVRFACVDGPDFDGRQVDWEEFLKRRMQYLGEETAQAHHTGCGG